MTLQELMSESYLMPNGLRFVIVEGQINTDARAQNELDCFPIIRLTEDVGIFGVLESIQRSVAEWTGRKPEQIVINDSTVNRLGSPNEKLISRTVKFRGGFENSFGKWELGYQVTGGNYGQPTIPNG